ncbi:MAG: hypothetical protein NC218_09470, partial [Acetobacter sp.]|nr:hypothetical protein [Acetobacter sp.]
MEGITILNTIAEEIHGGSLLGFGCIMGILLITCGILLIIANLATTMDGSMALALLVICLGMLGIKIDYQNNGPVIGYEYSYEVIVEDGVDFNEFVQHYEVIDQRG